MRADKTSPALVLDRDHKSPLLEFLRDALSLARGKTQRVVHQASLSLFFLSLCFPAPSLHRASIYIYNYPSTERQKSEPTPRLTLSPCL